MNPRPYRARLGFSGYVHMLATLRDKPDTVAGLIERTGIGRSSVCRLVPQFHAQGLIHVSGWLYGANIYTKPLYAYGPGKDAPLPDDARQKNGDKRTPRMPTFRGFDAEVISFAVAMRDIEQRTTQNDLIEATGLSRTTVIGLLRVLRKRDLARIVAWLPRDGRGAGARMACWVLGSGKNAPYPTNDRRAAQRAQRAVTAQRMRMVNLSRVIAGVGTAA